LKELELPQELRASDAVEIVRAWVAGEDIGFVTHGNVWQDPAIAGIFAADLLRHFIDTLEADESVRSAELQRAIKAFALELNVTLE
jgi:hypothetical protein